MTREQYIVADPTLDTCIAVREALGKMDQGEWLYTPDEEGDSMGWIALWSGHHKPAQELFDVRGDSAQQYINAQGIVTILNNLPALLAALEERTEALRLIDKTLRVPAAEYVPAIGDAFKIIDAALATSNSRK